MDIIKPVTKINFSVLTADIIRKKSVFPESGITRSDVYENQEPKKNGPLDLRMGTTRDEILCQTCGYNRKYCPGHSGHIKLGYPMINIGFRTYIKDILNCICIKCSSLRVDPRSHEIQKIIKNKKGKSRFNEIKNLTKNIKTCHRSYMKCDTPLPKIKIEDKKDELEMKLVAEFGVTQIEGDVLRYELSNQYVYDILQRISDDDWEAMGFNPMKSRPNDLIYTYLPVTPVACRPSAKIEGSSITNDDDITQELVHVIKHNNILNSIKDTPNVKNNIDFVQYHVNIIFSNDNRKQLRVISKNKEIKGVEEFLKSKEGIFRSHLMGKRNNYTARSVITGDPSLSVLDIGVPVFIAKNLTFIETVTQSNIKRLTGYLINGPSKYPGANIYLQLMDNGTYRPRDLKIIKTPITLKVGDKLERHMIDGDVVLFNRQPSLHKYSMMTHYVKVIDDPSYTTFRFNIGVTEPYHADYDGDEMNITIPRSMQSKIELEEITGIKKLLINCQTSKTIVGCKIDSIAGSYVLTKFEENLTGYQVMNILSRLKQTPNIKSFSSVDKNKRYTGCELVSFILPRKLNMKNKDFTIIDGEMIEGVLKKTYLGNGQTASLLRVILDLYNEDEAIAFFDNIQNMIDEYNMIRSLTLGYKDIEITDLTRDQVQKAIKAAYLEVGKRVTEMENDPSIETPENFETQLQLTLNGVRNQASDYCTSLYTENNTLKIMKESGSNSKVNQTNLAKNIILDGQNIVNLFGDVRPIKMEGRRTLPYFARDMDTADERGFSSHGFLHGLSLSDFIFNAYTSREGLIKIQLGTADSGYVQRKFIKCLEDYHVAYDGLVKNVNDGIIQFVYGDNNIDTSKQHKCRINILIENNKTIRDKYILNSTELKQFTKYTNNDNELFYNNIIELRDNIRQQQLKTELVFKQFNNLIEFYLPINILKFNSLLKSSKKSDLTPNYIIDSMNKLFSHETINIMAMKKYNINNESIKLKDEQLFKSTLKLIIYELLAPKRCIYEYKITKDNFDYIIEDIIFSYKKNAISPGEMVGPLAGMSLVEGITQGSLNSHHLTGVASKTQANGGLSRLKEITSVTKDIKTPIMKIYLNEELRHNEKYIDQLASYLRQTKLNEIYNYIKIIYDPQNTYNIDKDLNIFKLKEPNNDYSNNFNSLDWLVVINLQREEMLWKNIQLTDILVKILETWDKRYSITKKMQTDIKDVLDSITQISLASNNDNNTENFVYIRFKMVDYDISTLKSFSSFILNQVLIKGVENIREAEKNLASKYTIFDPITGDVDETNTEFTISTLGINIDKIRLLRNVDLNRTIINDLETINDIFGIEAVRASIINELCDISPSLNYNHVTIVADYMTREGMLISIDRNGIDHTDSSLFNKISFERPMVKLISAALFNESDNNNGVSSRISSGRCMRGGTGFCDLRFNSEMVMNSEYTDYDENTNNNIITDEYNTLIDDVMTFNDDGIFIPDDIEQFIS